MHGQDLGGRCAPRSGVDERAGRVSILMDSDDVREEAPRGFEHWQAQRKDIVAHGVLPISASAMA